MVFIFLGTFEDLKKRVKNLDFSGAGVGSAMNPATPLSFYHGLSLKGKPWSWRHLVERD